VEYLGFVVSMGCVIDGRTVSGGVGNAVGSGVGSAVGSGVGSAVGSGVGSAVGSGGGTAVGLGVDGVESTVVGGDDGHEGQDGEEELKEIG
jgi:hypothetical protein